MRLVLFLIPIVAGWVAVRATKSLYWHPEGMTGTIIWVVQAMMVAVAASHLMAKAANQFAPLSTLLTMTLVFPDHAPSRFGVALRAGTVGRMKAHELAFSGSPQQSAEQAIDLVVALGRHDRSTRGHTERVRAYADLLGQELGLDDHDLNKLRWGVLLHDIGKLAVPADILNKTGAPDDAEWAVLRTHPAEGAKMVAPLAPWLGPWAQVAADHHERWDGGGYPAGLVGEEISLGGRIAAVADAFDVITSKRSYKAPISAAVAREELVACSGSQFDPQVVRAFLQLGLHEKPVLGPFGWLFELPSLLRVTSNLAAAPMAAVSVVSAAAVVGTLSPSSPIDLAFADEPPPMAAAVIHDPADSAGFLNQLSIATETAAAAPQVAEVATTGTEPITTEAEPTTSAEGPTSTATTLIQTSTTEAPTTASTTTTTQVLTSALPSTSPPSTAAPTFDTPTTRPPTTTAQPATTAAPTTTAPTTTTTAPTTTTTTAAAPPSAPTGTGFLLMAPGDLPGSLSQAMLTSSDHVFVWPEASQVVLASPLSVSSFSQGQPIKGNSTATTDIAAGTTVCAWFIHADPSTIGNLAADIDFHQPILGYSLSRQRLANTASLFATPGLDYDGYHPLGEPDSLTATGTQLVFESSYVLFDLDQVRVYTSC